MANNVYKKPAAVDADELEIAQKEAENAGDTFTLTFKKPFEYEGKAYTELHFNWSSLTGKDALDIETELQALGIAVIVPTFSGAYLIRMAAKACAEEIGHDAFELMPMASYNRIRSAARSFLLASE